MTTASGFGIECLTACSMARRKLVAVAGGEMADRGARNDEAECVNGIGRVRNEHNVAGSSDRLCHVGEAFLRAERCDDLRLGIELHAEAAFVIGGLRLTQTSYALRRRVAVRARLIDGLDQLVDDVLRRWHVRVAHAEVDDVGTAGARRRLQTVDFREDVWRQALDAVKVFAQRSYPSAPQRDGVIMASFCARGPEAIRGHQRTSFRRARRQLPPSLRLRTVFRPVPRCGALRNTVEDAG